MSHETDKTLFNSRMVLLGILQIVMSLIGGYNDIAAFVQKFLAENPINSGDVFEVAIWTLMFVSGFCTIVLRVLTTKPIKLK